MSAEAVPFHFAGFSSPNFTSVPDEFFDVLAPNLSEAELRVLLYIMRRTFGFKKEADTISLKQMVEGITTRDGRVLDQGAGVARSTAWRGIKGLVAKGIIDTTRNASKARGDEATTYTLRFRDPVFRCETPPVSEETTPRVSERNTQETVLQETEQQRQFEHSNDTDRIISVDNLRITGYLDNLIVDISREFGDTAHLASNCKQARNIFTILDLSEEVFVERYVYQARQKTKHQTKVRQKMPYFFRVLRTMCGSTDAEEA
jgi:hypothetical protein